MKKIIFPIIILLIGFTGILFSTNSQTENTVNEKSLAEVNKALDDFHHAASKANENQYLGLMADDSIFLGTDPDERWTKEEFRQFVNPYFSQGRGWTYIPSNRHITFSQNGDIAWFDELLTNEHYGKLRGTGVLCWQKNTWKIVQYNMVFVIPNKATREVVELIKKIQSSPK